MCLKRWQKPVLLGSLSTRAPPAHLAAFNRVREITMLSKVSSAGIRLTFLWKSMMDDGDEVYGISPIGLLVPQRFERPHCPYHCYPNLKLIFRWLFIRF